MNEAITKKKYRSQGSYTERMRLKKIAKETMKITRQGYYELNGMRIELPKRKYDEVIAITPEQADAARWSLLGRKLSKTILVIFMYGVSVPLGLWRALTGFLC